MDAKLQSTTVAVTDVVSEFRKIVQSVLVMEGRHDFDVGVIDERTPLSSLPLDSLAWTFVIHGVEEVFDVEVADEVSANFVTVQSICDFLQQLT